jgi:crotonobetainyl-CoA:carnitine CoA-transferase CaiB-like acyl-CoA transferase
LENRVSSLLEGVRVIDLTNVLAGPFCGFQLALLGAEVIKVEVPGAGDLARQFGMDPELSAKGMGTGFLAQNAGKKSITLNLKSPEGKGGCSGGTLDFNFFVKKRLGRIPQAVPVASDDL